MSKVRIDKFKYFKYIGYIPHQGQMAVHRSCARFRVNVQGRRSGKSYCAAREAEVAILTPETRGWIVAPTYELADKIAREIKENLILKLKLNYSHKEEYYGRLKYVKFEPFKSELWIKSADNPDSLIGEGLDWLIFDEAAKCPRIIWEKYLSPTLTDRKGWALFTTTPEGTNWVYELYCRGQDPNYPEWESFRFPSTISPYIDPQIIEEARKTLTPETFAQEYLAEFTTFAGRVYAEFSRLTHIVKNYKYDPEIETVVGIDFGFRQPAVLWAQIRNGDEVVVFDEYVKPNTKTDELIQVIKSKPYRVDHYYCDPAGEGINIQSGLSDVELFRQNGIRLEYTKNPTLRSIPAGVELVRRFIMNAKGEIRLRIAENCARVISDIENYRYPHQIAPGYLSELPLKDGVTDHTMDALRYIIVNRFGQTGSRVEPIERRRLGL